MKKSITKIIIVFLIVLLTMEFVFDTNISNASVKNATPKIINGVVNLGSGLVTLVYWRGKLELVGAAYAVNHVLFKIASVDNPEIKRINIEAITPQDIFFNKFKLLDINFFDIDGVGKDTISYQIRTNVASWFFTIRTISSVILLVILGYVGIMMAISTLAEQKAKYKKMLYDWTASLILIYVIQYMAIFVIYLNNAIVKAVQVLGDSMFGTADLAEIYYEITKLAAIGIGMTSVTATIVYCGLTFFSIGFFIAYFNRMFKIGFLILISPLISITYSIDKMKDNKAQALGTWLKEFIYTVLIQPFHCIIYLSFTNTIFLLVQDFLPSSSGATAKKGILEAVGRKLLEIKNSMIGSTEYNMITVAVLAIVSLLFIKKAEEAVRKIFGFQDDNKGTSLAAGVAVTILALKNAKKIGGTALKGWNAGKNFLADNKDAIKNDFNKLKDSKAMQLAGEKAGALGGKLSDIGKAYIEGGKHGADSGYKTLGTQLSEAKSALGKGASKAKQKVSSKMPEGMKRKLKNSASTASRGAKFVGGKASAGAKFVGGKAAKGAKFVGGKASKAGKLAIKGFSKAKNVYKAYRNSRLGQFFAERNSLKNVLAALFGIASITGGDNPVETIGEAAAAREGFGTLLDNTESKLAKRAKKTNDILDKMDREDELKRYSDISDSLDATMEGAERNAANITGNSSDAGIGSYADRRNNLNNKADKLRKQAEKDRENGKDKEADKKEKQAESIEKDVSKIDSLMAQRDEQKEILDNFDSQEARDERYLQRSMSPKKTDLTNAINGLIQEMLTLQQLSSSGTPPSAKDKKEAKLTATDIQQVIERAALKDEDIDIEKTIKQYMGIGSRPKESQKAVYEKACEHARTMKKYYNSKNVAAIFSQNSSFNGSKKRLSKKMSKL